MEICLNSNEIKIILTKIERSTTTLSHSVISQAAHRLVAPAI